MINDAMSCETLEGCGIVEICAVVHHHYFWLSSSRCWSRIYPIKFQWDNFTPKKKNIKQTEVDENVAICNNHACT